MSTLCRARADDAEADDAEAAGSTPGTDRVTFLNCGRLHPIGHVMGTLAMTVTQASLAVVGAMVVVVVVVAALEVHTPAPRRRPTRLVLPRVIEGRLEELPEVDFAGLGRVEPLEPAAVSASVPVEPEIELEPVAELDLTDAPREPVTATGSVEETAFEEAAVDEAAVEETVVGETAVEEPAVEESTEVVRAAEEPALEELTVEEPVTELVPVVQMETWATEVVAPGSLLPAEAEVEVEDVGPPTEPVELVPVGGGPGRPGRRSDRGGGSTVWVVGVDLPDGAVAELGEPGADRDLAGVLFASYVVARRPERSRVTGWVTAKDTPPSQPAMEHGTKLRGRPTRVRDLLHCDDEDRNWVTLDPSVDIGRGVRRRPPVDPILVGLLRWWSATTQADARVPAEDVEQLCAGVEAVIEAASTNAAAATVRDLLALARRARDEGAGLRIESLSRGALEARRARVPLGEGTAAGPAERRGLVGSDR
jgi:hypothetical protein